MNGGLELLHSLLLSVGPVEKYVTSAPTLQADGVTIRAAFKTFNRGDELAADKTSKRRDHTCIFLSADMYYVVLAKVRYSPERMRPTATSSESTKPKPSPT
eukprot:SAG11_NODE_14229_length_620_cov_1.767754_2_plen_101_part_00